MQKVNEELQIGLIKLFNLPLIFQEREGKRYLSKIPEPSVEDKLLISNFAVEAEKLLVAYKKSELKSHNQTWNCDVTDFDNLSDHFTKILNIPLKPGETYRQQLIVICRVFFGVHFSNLDIEIRGTETGNKMSIAILDAVNDAVTYQLVLAPTIKNLKTKYTFVENVYYTSEGIQNDSITCPIFAYFIAKQLSKVPDFHALLKGISEADGKILWSNLPSTLLKAAQSLTFLLNLDQSNRCNKKGESPLSYFKRHCGFFTDTPDKPRNFAAYDFYLKKCEHPQEDF